MITFEKELDVYKQKYMDNLQKFISDKTPDKLIACIRAGTQYFNFAEKSIAKTKLDGLHNDGVALIDIAESCYAILESYVLHLTFIESNKSLLNSVYKRPSFVANNMQRMVKRYLPNEKVAIIRNLFIKHNLSTEGFDVKAPKDKNNLVIPLWIGGILLAIPIITLFFIPEPSVYQFFAFRVCFGLGGAGIASHIPGWLNVNINNWVKAGGAIAIFVLLWFFNPPALMLQ